ncbi:MAG: AbrB/MazE/SpoVT family DNA-binding domain-containing protein [Salinisphaera sp.]|nr:AbrB/MazE/SpoVT family DNA-binding domain-containing protein [Salinisphaera sp.]
MVTKIDSVGRIVIPKALRDAVGLSAGAVEIVVEGGGVRIEPLLGSGLVKKRGRLVIEGAAALEDDDVRSLRFADQK